MNDSPKLKYQSLIDKQKLSIDCPKTSCAISDKIGFRWTFNSLNDTDNFLPTILLNEKRNIPPRKNNLNEYEICSSLKRNKDQGVSLVNNS